MFAVMHLQKHCTRISVKIWRLKALSNWMHRTSMIFEIIFNLSEDTENSVVTQTQYIINALVLKFIFSI